jgi:hypothetical protein
MPASDKKNYVIALFACTTAGMGALLLQTRSELAEARKAPAMTVTRSEFNTTAAPAPIETTPASAPVATATATPAEPAAAQTPEAAPPNQGGPGGRGTRFMAQMAELMKDPEFAAAWKIEQEARVEQRYGAMFKDLNLPPAQLATLKTLLAERENAGREVWASAAAQGLNPRENRDELRQLADDLRAEVDANIESQLGASVITAIDTYEATRNQRNTVNDLSQKLSYSGQTLNSSQAKQLTNILTETGTPQGRNFLITDATITLAQSVLTSEQVAALKNLKTQQEAQQIVEEKTRAAREALGGGGNWRGGPPNRN